MFSVWNSGNTQFPVNSICFCFFKNMTLQVLFRFISEFVFKLYQEFHVVEGGTFSCNFDYTKLHVLLSYCTHETHKANILQDTRLLPIQLNGWPKPVECSKEEGKNKQEPIVLERSARLNLDPKI